MTIAGRERFSGVALLGMLLFGCGNDGGGGGGADARRIDAPGSSIDAGVDAAAIDAPPPAPCDLTPLGPGVRTLAGCEMPGAADGVRGVARFSNPVNVVALADGSAVVADFDNNRLRRVTADGTTTTLTVQVGFIRPFGLVVTPAGTVYVQTDANAQGMRDATTGTIWQVNTTSGVATPLIQNIGRPRGMAVLGDGRLVLSDYLHHVVSVWNPATPAVAPVVIAGVQDTPGFADGTGAAVRFNRPYGMVVQSDGSVIVADYENHRLRQVTVAGVVTTFAGDGVAGNVDGPSATARFNKPQDLALDGAGRIYVVDSENYRVRRVAAGAVTSVMGDGTPGYIDAENHLAARIFGLEGIDFSAANNRLLIADGNRGELATNFHNRVRVATIP